MKRHRGRKPWAHPEDIMRAINSSHSMDIQNTTKMMSQKSQESGINICIWQGDNENISK